MKGAEAAQVVFGSNSAGHGQQKSCWFLVGIRLAMARRMASKFFQVLVAAATLCVASPAAAEHENTSGCGDFGGSAVLFGGAAGLGAAAFGAFTMPVVAIAANSDLPYWPGVGYTMATGSASVLLTSVALSSECPMSSLYLPTLVALPVEAITTIVWASNHKPDPKPSEVSLVVGAPRSGSGVVVGLGKAF